jgi:hypothetical protein
MKTLIYVLLVIGGIVLWQKHTTSAAHSSRGAGHETGSGTVVITYHDNAEFIQKLRQVKTGQRVESRCLMDGVPVATGLSCSDTVGVAAYKAQMDRQLEEENRQIETEFRRIQGQ